MRVMTEEQSAGEQRHVDVGRLHDAVDARDGTGHHREDTETSVRIGRTASEPAKSTLARSASVGELPSRVGLPCLHERVGDRFTCAIGDPTTDPERSLASIAHDVGAIRPRERHPEVGADGLRWGRQELGAGIHDPSRIVLANVTEPV